LKKVLIITYYWPPSGGAGVQRWLKFVKYLREFGWEPVVYTPENPEAPAIDHSLEKDIPEGISIVKTKIREPYSLYKKVTGQKSEDKIKTGFLSEKKKPSLAENMSVWIRGNLFIPDARKFWIKPSVKFLTKYLKDHPVDALVSTGPPHSMHMIAMGIKKKLNLPWLADFRDPWTNIDFYDQLKLTKRADRKHHALEKQVLTEADVVCVVSPGMTEDFRAKVKREYTIIPNGYDAADLQAGVNVPKSEKFTLSHIGSLTRTRNAGNLWLVLAELVKEDEKFAEDLEIRNVGKMDYHVGEMIEKAGLKKYLVSVDYLPHEQVIEEQKKASLLLLLINNTPNAKMILTGKLFEYLISETPVVCIGPPDGDAANILKQTNCGEVFDFSDRTSLKSYIIEAYHKFKAEKLASGCAGVEQYERHKLTEKMADVLERITVEEK
jgi:hypothetical protein